MTYRLSVADFQLANRLYVGATVAFYTVDVNGVATATLATLYASPTGSTTLANPQTLDGEGKFAAPVYITEPVIAAVIGRNVESHSTGILGTVFSATPLSISGGVSGQILILNGSLVPVWRTPSGAFTIDNNGVATLTPLAASDLTNGTTGTGNVVLRIGAALITPALGVATATSLNGITFTPSTGTFTLTDGKTFKVDTTIEFDAVTAGRKFTFPTASGNVLTADSTATMTGKSIDTAGTGNHIMVGGVDLVPGQLKGTGTNDTAAAGNVGEILSATLAGGSAVSLTTVTPANVISKSFTAGRWLIWADVYFVPAATTTSTKMEASITASSATRNTLPGEFAQAVLTAADAGAPNITAKVGPIPVFLATPTTLYAVAYADFSTSTMLAYGKIQGVRI